MVDLRFRKLPDFAVWFSNPAGGTHEVPGTPATGGVVSIPDHVYEIDAAIDVLNEIESSYVADLDEHRPLIENLKDHVYDERFTRYRSREIWRIGSYVVFVCALEGILRRSYPHLTSTLARINLASARAVEQRDSARLKDREKEMESFNLLRNKVFAHTSFADPRRDSFSLQMTSLWNFSGRAMLLTGVGLLIGGLSITIGGQPAEKEFPLIGLARMCRDAAAHIQSWFDQHLEVMNLILSNTDDEMKRAWPGAIMIARRKPQS